MYSDLADASGNDLRHGELEDTVKIFITDSQSECDPRNKFLDMSHGAITNTIFPFTVQRALKPRLCCTCASWNAGRKAR